MDRIGRVLLIDDNEIDQRQYKRVLDRSGLVDEVLVYSYAEEALDYVTKTNDTVDLIFLDINMPRMNGFEFLDRLVEHAGEPLDSCIIFMLTTSLNRADKDRALSYDAVKEFINKPLSTEDVVTAARLVAAKRRG